MTKLQQIINNAFDQGLITDGQPCSMTIIFVDDDGTVVTCPITHEALDDYGVSIVQDIGKDMFHRRSEIRDGKS